MQFSRYVGQPLTDRFHSAAAIADQTIDVPAGPPQAAIWRSHAMNPASATGVASLKLSDALLQHPNPHPQRLGLVLDPPNQCAATEGDPNDYQGAHSSR